MLRPILLLLNNHIFHITAMGRPYSDLALPTTKHERMLNSPTLSYKRACPAEHNEYWVVDAEPNDIMPPPPDGQWARPEP